MIILGPKQLARTQPAALCPQVDRGNTDPNPIVAAVHNRMPVILGPEHYQWWLETDRFEPQFLKPLLRPYPAEDMDCHRVSKLVNSAKNDSPECIQKG